MRNFDLTSVPRSAFSMIYRRNYETMNALRRYEYFCPHGSARPETWLLLADGWLIKYLWTFITGKRKQTNFIRIIKVVNSSAVRRMEDQEAEIFQPVNLLKAKLRVHLVPDVLVIALLLKIFISLTSISPFRLLELFRKLLAAELRREWSAKISYWNYLGRVRTPVPLCARTGEEFTTWKNVRSFLLAFHIVASRRDELKIVRPSRAKKCMNGWENKKTWAGNKWEVSSRWGPTCRNFLFCVFAAASSSAREGSESAKCNAAINQPLCRR